MHTAVMLRCRVWSDGFALSCPSAFHHVRTQWVKQYQKYQQIASKTGRHRVLVFIDVLVCSVIGHIQVIQPPSHCIKEQFSVLTSLCLQPWRPFLRILNIPGLSILVAFTDICRHPQPCLPWTGIAQSFLTSTSTTPLYVVTHIHSIRCQPHCWHPSLPTSPAQTNTVLIRHWLATYMLKCFLCAMCHRGCSRQLINRTQR